jgi:acetyltransferase
MSRGDLKRMLNPESIALIGATEKEGSVGRDVFENLYYWSKERQFFPVNPSRGTVFGVKCYPSILQVPEHVDLSLIAIPATKVPGAVQECGQAGVDGTSSSRPVSGKSARKGKGWRKKSEESGNNTG